MSDLARGIGRVNSGDDATGISNTVEEQRILGDVWGHEPKRVALAEAPCRKSTSKRLDTSTKLTKRHFAVRGAIDDRRFVGQRISMTQCVVSDRDANWDLDIWQI